MFKMLRASAEPSTSFYRPNLSIPPVSETPLVLQSYLAPPSVGEYRNALGERFVIKMSFPSLEFRFPVLHQLHQEAIILRKLNKTQCPGVPKLVFYGKVLVDAEALVTQPVGIPVTKLMEPTISNDLCQKIGKDILSILHEIHKRGIIHADVCPQNIILESLDPPKARLIDFGVSIDTADNEEHWNNPVHELTCSICSTIGLPVEELDDIESLVYSLFWLQHNSLPWEKEKDRDVILRKKWELLLSGEPETFLPRELVTTARERAEPILSNPSKLNELKIKAQWKLLEGIGRKPEGLLAEFGEKKRKLSHYDL